MGVESQFPTRLPETYADVQKYIEFKKIDPENTTVAQLNEEMGADSKNVPIYMNDKKFWYMALYFIGGTIIICILSSAILAGLSIDVPEILVTSTSTLIGVIAGLFAGSIQSGK